MTRTFSSIQEQQLYDALLELHTAYIAGRLHIMEKAGAIGLTVATVNQIARQSLIDGSLPENRDRVAQVIHQLEHVGHS